GQSEENLRKAIRIAEAAAPCVLWIDEIEKGFSGIGDSNDSMTRMFGYFLSWLQDKTSGVYVIATANNASNLPPELKRKGRFDEIFCVNLPNDDERKKIFEVHIAKKKKRSADWEKIKNHSSFKTLIEKTKGFNGADIEAVVNEAVEGCFLKSLDKKDGAAQPLEIADLIKIAGDTISITKSCKPQIEAMEKIFKESSFKDASK
ncbi:MAG: AAA family ATPase, partial [Muribaculaceae bacterium]|nr:AAA family ATPase [Muribaculaceae bacterium]